jgi:Zn ribbon nucleic-acid-binding protein
MSGKGDKRRPPGVDYETYAGNWDRIFNKGKQMGDFKEYIECSHCGYADEEVPEYPRTLVMDGDQAGWTCPACYTVHTVTLSVTFEFRAVPGYRREIGIT